MALRNMALAILFAGVLISGGQQAIAQDCGDFAVTDNGEFSIEFLQYVYDPNNRYVTLYYEVCKLGRSPQVKDLSHWSIDLHGFVHCLRADRTADDFLIGCAQTAPFPAGETPGPYILEGADDPNAPKCELGIDPTTQVPGLKFDDLNLGNGECQRFAFRLDLKCLRAGHTATAGCVEVSTKAGHQDIRDEPNTIADPGYTHVTGPVCSRTAQ
jgi:hypothetical protein